MVEAVSTDPTTTSTLTNTAQSFSANSHKAPRKYRVYADRNAHISVAGTATASSFPITALEAVVVTVPPAASISFVRSATEIDGNIWATLVG